MLLRTDGANATPKASMFSKLQLPIARETNKFSRKKSETGEKWRFTRTTEKSCPLAPNKLAFSCRVKTYIAMDFDRAIPRKD